MINSVVQVRLFVVRVACGRVFSYNVYLAPCYHILFHQHTSCSRSPVCLTFMLAHHVHFAGSNSGPHVKITTRATNGPMDTRLGTSKHD